MFLMSSSNSTGRLVPGRSGAACSVLLLLLGCILINEIMDWKTMKITFVSGNGRIDDSGGSSSSVDESIRKKENEAPLPTVDGIFQGYNVSFISETMPTSKIHCVGETFSEEDDWMYRSCHFRNLCWDLNTSEFVLFTNEKEKAVRGDDRYFLSTLLLSSSNISVSRSPFLQIYRRDGKTNVTKWFPRVEENPHLTDGGGYHALPSGMVWMPYEAIKSENPGHMLGDNLLPIFTLLSLFSLQEKQVMLTWVSPNVRTPSLSVKKYLPLLGLTSLESIIPPSPEEAALLLNKSRFVCAEHGAAGVGMLADHGATRSDDVWRYGSSEDYNNFGRGFLFHQFRQYMLNNAGVEDDPERAWRKPPHQKVVVSINSSSKAPRKQAMEKQIETLRREFSNNDDHHHHHLQIDAYEMKNLSLREQIELATRTTIYVTAAGGGSATAIFLPKGASLILFYDDATKSPHLNDADTWNNMRHLRVQWLPISDKDEEKSLEIFSKLVEHELEAIATGA